MLIRQNMVLDTLRRVQLFLDRNDGVLGVINKSGARKTLDAIVAQLSTHAVNQDAGRVNSKGETAKQRAVRLALRSHMRPVAAFAKAKLRDVPEFKALTLPDSRMNANRLVAAAGAMADAATPHAQVFVDSGLPADFVPQLIKAADDVSGSIDTRAESRGRRVGATAGLSAEDKKGRNALAILDTLVVPMLGTNDQLLAEWRSLKRVDHKPGRVIGQTTPAPTPVPTPVTPVHPVTPVTPVTPTPVTPVTPQHAAAQSTTSTPAQAPAEPGAAHVA